jgi:hypothetical protein
VTSFATKIAAIPYNPINQEASGLFAPIMRAAGHILYAMAAYADPGYTIPEEEIRRELQHATNHLASTASTADAAPISTSIKEQITRFCDAVYYASVEWPEWPEESRSQNLKNLANRATAIAAYCDWELAGIRNSDPGQSL